MQLKKDDCLKMFGKLYSETFEHACSCLVRVRKHSLPRERRTLIESFYTLTISSVEVSVLMCRAVEEGQEHVQYDLPCCIPR